MYEDIRVPPPPGVDNRPCLYYDVRAKIPRFAIYKERRQGKVRSQNLDKAYILSENMYLFENMSLRSATRVSA